MKLLQVVGSIVLVFMSAALSAEVVVIGNLANDMQLDASDVRKIYLGKTKELPNGERAIKYDLPKGAEAREEFRKRVLGKTESRLNSYWARMQFSSKGQPPEALSSAEAVKQAVSENGNAIAYLDSVDVDGSVKVLFTVK